MNILLVSGPGISLKEPFNSGIEAFIVSLGHQLIYEGHTVHIVASDAEADVRFKLVNPFTKYHLIRPPFLKNLREKRQFQKLDVDSYDIIHYNMFYPHLLKAGLRFNKPFFLTLHSPADNKRVLAYREIARSGDVTFVSVSERIKRQWDQGLEIDTFLVNNGINLKRWPVKDTDAREYLLWSARINEEKNVAAAISIARHMRMPLKIAGRITDQHYFDNEVTPHLNSQIQYVGHVTQGQLSDLAKNASAFLATATWQEPFGLAALEMLASGVPVVGFSTAVPTNWKHESVLTTTSRDWQDLAGLIVQSNSIDPASCQAFASGMTVQHMTSGYVTLYKKALLQKGIQEK